MSALARLPALLFKRRLVLVINPAQEGCC